MKQSYSPRKCKLISGRYRATIQSRQGQKAYVYRFGRQIPATGEYAGYGAFHTGEVAYAYDNLRFIDRQLRPLELAQVMSAYWVNFIKTGDPNSKGLPQWPTYTLKDRQITNLNTKATAGLLPDGAALDARSAIMSGQQ